MNDEVIEGKRAVSKNPERRTRAALNTGSSGKFNPFNLAAAERLGKTLPPPFPKSAKTVVEVSPG